MFAHQDARGPVEIAFTDRHPTGGGPSASLDLGRGVTSAPGPRANLQQAVAGLTGLPVDTCDTSERARVVAMHQVHGAAVHVVDDTWLADDEAGSAAVPVADALVTALPGVVLLVRVADCVPVLLADPAAGVVAAVHAGRPGVLAGVVPAAIATMRERGATELVAWVGPHVCGRCYEVPAAMRAEVAAAVPASYATTSWGTPALDLGAGVRAQLDSEGVELAMVSGRCTREDEDLFSYRRQGDASGRLGGLIWRRP